MRDIGSVWRGLKLMARSELFRGWATRWIWGFWAHWWTPIWHERRGPYISIGCGLFAIYRGY